MWVFGCMCVCLFQGERQSYPPTGGPKSEPAHQRGAGDLEYHPRRRGPLHLLRAEQHFVYQRRAGSAQWVRLCVP